MPEIALQARGLTKRYGELTAVDDLNLEVWKGEVFGLLGPNGAGKTTSINMMVGLLKPDAGEVWVQGERVANGGADWRARVGVCPQQVVLWKRLTCLEQLQFIGEMYGVRGREARKRGKDLLTILSLADRQNQQADQLSGGMQRRLNLALALVHDPEIVVLDEPEAGLDPQSRVMVREFIKELAREKTVILTTHNMDEADRLADRVAIIDHGRLLVLDTPEALKAQVGEGDVVEIALEEQAFEDEAIASALARLDAEVTWEMADGALLVRGLHVMRVLPMMMEALGAAGLRPGEVRVRENTLEDVFIRLTGRRLRE